MKVYKGRQKVSFEQAGQYYSFAYHIGVEHGKFTEQDRIIKAIKDQMPRLAKDFYTSFKGDGNEFINEVIKVVKGEQK